MRLTDKVTSRGLVDSNRHDKLNNIQPSIEALGVVIAQTTRVLQSLLNRTYFEELLIPQAKEDEENHFQDRWRK